MQNGSQLLPKIASANEILATSTACLSIFGTTFIIVSYFAWKDIQSTSRRILVYISVADFFTSVGTIMGLWSSNHLVCTVQSTMGTLAVLCSFFWTVFMSVYLYVSLARKQPRTAEKLMILFHTLGWGVPVVVTAIAAATKKLGNDHDDDTSGWCWVNTALKFEEQILWMLLAGKGWEIAAYIIITVLYVLLRQNIKKVKELQISNDQLFTESAVLAAERAERKLILIPVVFISLRIWSTIRFFIYITKRSDYYGWLLIMQGVGDSGQGFANFLLFCFFTERVFRRLRMCWIKICPGLCMVLHERNTFQPPLTKDGYTDLTSTLDSLSYGAINDVCVNSDCVSRSTSYLDVAPYSDPKTMEHPEDNGSMK